MTRGVDLWHHGPDKHKELTESSEPKLATSGFASPPRPPCPLTAVEPVLGLGLSVLGFGDAKGQTLPDSASTDVVSLLQLTWGAFLGGSAFGGSWIQGSGCRVSGYPKP